VNRGGKPAPPVRLAHLGLGNFFRAHQVWYTHHSGDAEYWGYSAFAGRSAGIAGALNRQQGLYTVVTRGPDGDQFEVVGNLSVAHAADDHLSWLDLCSTPDLAVVTVTVTEAGWLGGRDGGLDRGRAEVQADVDALRRDSTSPVSTAPARLLAGLAARRRADGGPLSLVPCDNIPSNGGLAGRVLADLADLVDPTLGPWMAEYVDVSTTVVDRITPRTTPDDIAAVAATGLDDSCPVVTEPFHEWVLSGGFPNGRPTWEDAGATFVADARPFERRKLWLLNGAHSLLAYAGTIRGHVTVPAAAADPTCRAWVEEWWDEASSHLGQPPAEIGAYRLRLLVRFANTRLADRLARIAADGSQKLRIRVIPVLLAERAVGRVPVGAARIVAAWICHLRGHGAPIDDARADEVVPLAQGPVRPATVRVLDQLHTGLGDDPRLVDAVVEVVEQLIGPGRQW
jgi:fructuronate reductase